MSDQTTSLPNGSTLAGKTIIITGGNKGLGFEVARQAILLSASRVIITTRSEVRGRNAIAALRENAEIQHVNPKCQLEFFDLDLEDYQSALRFCQQVKEQVPELDLLLCNGGITLYDFEDTKGGHEKNMQVNCYTHFFIVFELLGLLRATAARRSTPTRVTFLGSFNHFKSDLEKVPIPPNCTVLEYFDNKKLITPSKRYFNSKLAIIGLAQKLASLVPASEVIVNSGGRSIIHAAVEAGAESHGKFLPMGGQVVGHTPFLDGDRGKMFKEQLWKELLEEGRSVDPALEPF
ncbi:uncharacterized protein N7483_001182 [Penicillium malachiteum]|uniref:uncharacterized protein n=1 Tax=Penicillium malachiteum TaxID=1324776 RepID=UPI0025467F09|nr:uncharacterized protein N7483_001182 [Penicillium malachiteum]KAJ5736057.1 hypothetical protein N7483_001182 [Penicillium malachiteum]